MNCPKCQKKLPKGNPRVCPNCKKDLSNYYKLLEKNGELKTDANKRTFKPLLILLALAACVIAAVVLVIALSKPKTDPEPETTTAAAAEAFDMEAVKAEINSKQVSDFVESAEPTDYVKLTITNFGEIVVRLRPDVAPISAQNFQDLVARHYYDGLSFHRVIPGFMIQGGMGSESLTPIKGEFSANGVENPLLHVRGVLSMARTTVMDSGTSQFFLMHADYPSLNGNYAAFGYIVAGLETVDKVCEIELGYDSRNEKSVPQVDVILESAVFVTPKQ
jgi:peptidyl-prolyl cis-trans isomerase B (cyclophilin B)